MKTYSFGSHVIPRMTPLAVDAAPSKPSVIQAHDRIFGRVLMAARAVCSRLHLSAPGFPCNDASCAAKNAAPAILGTCDGFKMRRIHTTANAAFVVYLKPIWNRAYEFLVSNTVRVFGAAGNEKFAVALVVERLHPQPATGFGNDLNARKDALAHWSVFGNLGFSHLRNHLSALGQCCAALLMLSRPDLNYTAEGA